MAAILTGNALQPFQQLFDSYCDAYQSMDVERIGQFFSLDEVHCFGTGEDEVLLNRDSLLYALERDFSELSNVTLRPEGKLTAIQTAEAVCLCTNVNVQYSLKNSPEKANHMPKLRFTVLLEQQQDDWRIVQIHISAPLVIQKTGRSFPED